ncbi:hypothetical protein [Marilutibacter spongiae]|uniref:Uncharacterized protein n=1 Tax=Marilutibacter spongiae TaxID=2025720 RepID=A0A7W3Y6T8_9GAMM|nr:hypothetical protein [Lysobacter spongiae]MBB1061843.1 hypothetical protein [Lysobacter spongiae]
MNRRVAAGSAGLALLAAAAAWAWASGAIPHPFAPADPPIELVESGSSKARDLGERFEPSPKPSLPDGTLPGTADPFHVPDRLVDKPPRPADDPPGWQNPFDMPSDLVKPADLTAEAWQRRKRAREAAFGAESRFPANPQDDRGSFRFDWAIVHTVDSADLLADFEYHVNSADGSALVAGDAIRPLLGHLPAAADIDFLLRKANGDLLACGTHDRVGKACLKLGEDLPAAFAWLGHATRTGAFLSSIASTPQRLGSPPPGRARGARGRVDIDGEPHYLQVWVAPGASPVATQVAWLGMGSGVLKDTRSRINREVRRVRYEGIDRDGGDVVVDTESIRPSVAARDTRDYRIVTAFGSSALAEATAIGAGMQEVAAREVQALDRALRECLPGDAGRACRRLYREKIKAANAASRDEALDWARQQGLTVD